jgi:hypothetical protein
MTVAQLVYVNNRVLLARIEYWTKTTFLSESQCKSLHNRFIKLLKNKMRIVSTAHNNIFTHQGIIGFLTLHQHLRSAQFAEFIIRINSNDWDGISTRIILRKTQLRAGLSECILTVDSQQILCINMNNNFNFNVLKAMKDQLFSFDIVDDISSWNIDSEGPTIMSIFRNTNNVHQSDQITQDFRKKVINNFMNRAETYLGLIFLKQLWHKQGSCLLTWKQIKYVLDLSLKGPKPLFFKTLELIVLSPAANH